MPSVIFQRLTNLNGIRVFPFGVDPERLSQAVKATGSNSNSNN